MSRECLIQCFPTFHLIFSKDWDADNEKEWKGNSASAVKCFGKGYHRAHSYTPEAMIDVNQC